jgi:hypothetical protein
MASEASDTWEIAAAAADKCLKDRTLGIAHKRGQYKNFEKKVISTYGNALAGNAEQG